MSQESASVLLVDDDPAARRTIKTYLQRKGIPIIDTSSGEDAWQILSGQASGVQLLISDLNMPGMTGAALAALVRSAGHSFPILLITGYCDEPAGPSSGIEIMPKPLDLGALLTKVRELTQVRG